MSFTDQPWQVDYPRGEEDAPTNFDAGLLTSGFTPSSPHLYQGPRLTRGDSPHVNTVAEVVSRPRGHLMLYNWYSAIAGGAPLVASSPYAGYKLGRIAPSPSITPLHALDIVKVLRSTDSLDL